MTTSTRSYRVHTSHGAIFVEEAGGGKTTLVFIHGNSSCRTIFQHQLSGPMTHNCRLIALDLPGHGDSEDATVSQRSYTRSGLRQFMGFALPSPRGLGSRGFLERAGAF